MNWPHQSLIHPLYLTICLSVVGGCSKLLHPAQLTEVGHHMSCECLPPVTDKVSRSTKQTKITLPQGFGCGSSRLVLDHIHYYMFREVVLRINSTFLISGFSWRSIVSSIVVKSMCKISPWPLQGSFWSLAMGECTLKFLAPGTVLDLVDEVMRHAWPSESAQSWVIGSTSPLDVPPPNGIHPERHYDETWVQQTSRPPHHWYSASSCSTRGHSFMVRPPLLWT